MKLSRKKKNFLIILLLVLLCGGGLVFYYVQSLFLSPLNKNLTEKTYLYIDTDDTLDSVQVKIVSVFDLDKPSFGFNTLADVKDYKSRIRTGKYEVSASETPYSLFLKLSRGYQIPTRLVINNIRTLDQLAGKLGDQLMLDSLELNLFFQADAELEKLGYNRETLPALFIPNTYEVYWDMDMEGFITRMITEHKRFWTDERLKKAEEIGLTPIEVATLASIVEEETNSAEEKPMVAGLYMNRLTRGIPLQADPTIKFALNDFAMKRILNENLKVESPYNTYLNTGLPPGPIRLASIPGLESVLNYAQHNYIYMCAKEDFSGKHNFATNLNDHMANARRYWSALNKLKIYK